MRRAFAAFFGPTRDRDGDLERVHTALDGADGSLRSGSLALAWQGDDEPRRGDHIVLVDGELYGSTVDDLASAFASRGERCFTDLRGDFVIVIHDAANDELIVARDHMGGRGVLWSAKGDRLALASDARHLLALLDEVPDPDLVAVAHLLAPSAQPVARSLYSGVHRLEGAHVLHAGRGGVSTRRYWSPRYRSPTPGSRAEHVEDLRAMLTQAVSRRCSGADTGVMLSGGLDSSSVAGVGSTLAPDRRPRRAYSATFPLHPSADEGGLIAKVCEQLGLASTRAVVRRGSVAAGALEYIEHWRLPPPSPNLFFWFPLLRRAATDGVGSLLDGEGGDELFGLSPYLIADRVRRGRLRAANALIRDIPGGGPHIKWPAIKPFLLHYGIKGVVPPGVEAMVRRARGGRRYAPAWLRPEVTEAYMDTDTSGVWKRLDGPRWWAYQVSRVTRGSAAAVTFDHVRRRAAIAGIEARHPLVDVDLIEYVLSIPPELSYDPRYSRPLLREAVSGILPEEVRVRPTKSNFDAIFHEALAGPDLDVARALLQPGRALIEQYVDLGVVATDLLAEPPPEGGRRFWGQWVWRLLTAELWLRVQAGAPVDVDLAQPEVDVIGP